MIEHVEHRAFEPLIRAARRAGLDEDALTAGLSFTHESLLEGRGYVPWDDFALYCDRLEAAFGGPEAVVDIGRVLTDGSSYATLLRVGGLFTSPKLYYTVVERWLGRMLVPAVRSYGLVEHDTRTLEMTVSIPPHLRDSPAFFHILASLLRYGPTLVGLQPAAVTYELQPRRGIFTIRVPPSSSLLARARGAIQAVWDGGRILDELVTQQERMFESYRSLRRSEDSFRALIESSPNGIIVYTPERVVYANASMARFLHMERVEDLIGRPIESLSRQPGALALWREDVPRHADRTDEVAFVTATGGEVWAEVSVFAAQFDRSEAYVCIARDVTLRYQILARASEMGRMISMGMLAAGVGHEIKNPLTFLEANVEYAHEAVDMLVDRLEAGPLDAAAHDEILDELHDVARAMQASARGIDRLLTIARDLNAFSHSASPEPEPVDLNEVIDTALNITRHEIRHRATIVRELEPLPTVHANAGQLGQILVNLLVNAAQAIDYGAPDDNTIRVRTHRLQRDGRDHAVIEIEDTGHGIPEDDLEHVFEPFYTTKPVGEGTGLGLAISRDIIDALGGELTLHSTPGAGTCARIVLELHG